MYDLTRGGSCRDSRWQRAGVTADGEDAMKFSSRFHVQCSRLGAKISTGLLAVLLVAPLSQGAEVRERAEAEGKLMMYATFTAADSKTLLDGFKQVYPKIDAAYYRSNDAALMERFVSENRARQNLCDVI